MAFNFVSGNWPYLKTAARISPIHRLYFIRIDPLSAAAATTKSMAETSDEPSSSSLTVSYLINSCGFSPEKALSASRYMNIRTPDKADSVVAFFCEQGFSKTQIASLIRKHPPILLSDPIKIYMPKLEFLRSKGLSTKDIATLVSITPDILRRSLGNHIVPTFNYFHSFLNSQEKAALAIKRFGGMLVYDLQIYFADNIEVLREVGVPESNIILFFVRHPRVFLCPAEKFKAIVKEVMNSGFDPKRQAFVAAIHVVRGLTKSTWKRKVDAYKNWGWSEDDFVMAFRRYPRCMAISEDKIVKVMDFFSNKMGWKSSVLARTPVIMSMSLERRIIPRCSIYRILLSKGLLNKDEISPATFLVVAEKTFLDKFVKCYKEEAPELLKFVR